MTSAGPFRIGVRATLICVDEHSKMEWRGIWVDRTLDRSDW